MTKWFVAFVLSIFPSVTFSAQTRPDIQDEVLRLTPTAQYAVLPVFAWIDTTVPGQEKTIYSIVIGTAFVINNHGDFITAAHVASTREIGTGTNKLKVSLTVGLRQQKAGISGVRFEVVEIDQDHDLALCHLKALRGVTFEQTGLRKFVQPKTTGGFTAEEMSQPFASLAIDHSPPRAGRFVLVSGFPLTSWTPAIQFGMLAATSTLYADAPIARVAKDNGELLQVSVSANHGNSGGPVIDLQSGRVVGVILSLVPAPLAINGQQVWGEEGYDMSGIMLAAPAKWVNDLLVRHSLKSEAVPEGKLFWSGTKQD